MLGKNKTRPMPDSEKRVKESNKDYNRILPHLDTRKKSPPKTLRRAYGDIPASLLALLVFVVFGAFFLVYLGKVMS